MRHKEIHGDVLGTSCKYLRDPVVWKEQELLAVLKGTVSREREKAWKHQHTAGPKEAR